MKTTKKLFLTLTLIFSFMTISSFANNPQDAPKADTEKVTDNSDKLVVVWSSGDRDVALDMVFMYTSAAKKYGWWEDIIFIIWGPSAKLLAGDKELQEYIKEMQNADIVTVACKACADSYGVSDQLGELGIKVRYSGQELTKYIKGGWHVVTF